MIDKVFQFLWKKSSLASSQNLVFSGQEWFRLKLHLWLNNAYDAYRCWDLWTKTWHFRIGSFPRVSKEVFTRSFNAAHVCFIIHFAFFLFELSTYPVIPPPPPPRRKGTRELLYKNFYSKLNGNCTFQSESWTE